MNCFERANIPGLLDEERENQLTFAVIGASPTGIKNVRIKIIEAAPTDVSEYKLEAKPKGLFSTGPATRANVAHCMVREEWKFKMPVLHDKTTSASEI